MLTPSPAADATALAWQAFTALAEVHRRRTLAIARDLELSPPQMWALRYLVPGEPRPMGELTAALVCESSNVTGISDRLEARGLVERQPFPTDRRVRALVLTAAGIAMREEIIRRVAEPAPGFDALGPEADEQLAALLTRLADAVVAADGLALPPAEPVAPA